MNDSTEISANSIATDDKNSYIIGVTWFILSLCTSAISDILSKYLGTRLNIYQVVSFRFFFSFLSLLPVIIYNSLYGIAPNKPMMVHCYRGALLFIGTICWTYGLTIEQVTTATVVTFTIPVFTLSLGAIFLKEKIAWQKWFCNIIAFLGLLLALQVNSHEFNYKILVFIVAAICFSALDIVNKNFVHEESTINMLFYSALFTAVLSSPFSIYSWVTPHKLEIFLLFSLGVVANMTLFFLLKAFAATNLSNLIPCRYIEFLISSIAAYIFFAEVPAQNIIYSILIIIPPILFISYSRL
ncbi:MAG: DMT family transporter [Janthinobacterium lividum]